MKEGVFMIRRKSILPMILSTLLLVSNVPAFTAYAEAVNQSAPVCSRLQGSDRYATSLAICQSGWSHADNVIIATGTNFPDALSASALSKSKDAPIILAEKDGLSNDAIYELKRLGTAHAYIAGGTGVIGTSVENQLKNLNIDITRFGGTDRYDTSRQILQYMGVKNGVAIATGTNFPDALSIAPIASMKKMPVLLSTKSGLDNNMINYLWENSTPASYIIGGTGVLNDMGVPNSKRLCGSDRYGTNLSINNEFAADLNFNTVYLATGLDFPDALSGSALAAKNNAPVILTDRNSISQDTLNLLKSKNVKHVVILGGTGAVSQTVEDKINAALYVNITSISLNKTTDTLKIGDTDTLTATVSPSNASNSDVSWSSSNTSVAAVDSTGKVTAVSIGTAIITAATVDGDYKANCTVTVNPVNVTSVSLNKTSDALTVGGTDTLIATVSPENATNKNVNWASSDTSVATVNSTGLVTAKSEGTTIITVTTVDGGLKSSCTVTVGPVKVTSVSLNKTTDKLVVGNTEQVTAIVSPSNATNQNVNWTSSDTSVATVDSTGMVTAKSEGTAIITVTTQDGGFAATLTLTVEKLKIESIDDINADVYQWDSYTLPDKVIVNLNNGAKEYRPVVWNSAVVDTSVVGKEVYQGTVDGYEGSVKLNLNVKSFQSDLLLTGRGYSMIGAYIYSYSITLTSNVPKNINVDKVELYINGNLRNTFTKDELTANNIPTVITPNSQWGFGVSFNIGVTTTNSYFIVYINNNGHDIPCTYPMTV